MTRAQACRADGGLAAGAATASRAVSLQDEALRRAFEAGQFALHYQPKIDTHSGAICGAEALLRWPRGGAEPLSAHELVLALERTGLIVAVGRWVIEQAVADRRRWRAAGLREVPIAVNVSRLQLQQPDFVDSVSELVAAEARGIEFEITESVVMDDVAGTADKLQRLRGLGATIALDDFGDGYSSLSCLARLPIDTIKLGRGFSEGMESYTMRAVVAAVVGLARVLSLRVVAEGVESPRQHQRLRELGCHEVQGYLFARPMAALQFAERLRHFDGASDGI